MRQLFKFSFAMILVLAFCSNILAQTSLSNFGLSNSEGTRKIEAPLAPVVFLNQAPNSVNGLFADATCALCPSGQQTIADNFAATIVNATTGITELVIWGGYYPEDIPNTTDNFTFILHSDAGGMPGPVVTTLINQQAATRVQTGIILFGTHEYKFTFDFNANPIMVPTTGTYWLELFNNSTQSGNFYWETGALDGTHGILGSAWYTTTPGTAWNLDGATDLSAQINGFDNVTPCPVGAPTNVSPPNGSTGLPLNGNTLTWTNGAGTVSNEVWFGPSGSLSKIYDGAAKTSHSLPTLNYNTIYQWYIVCKDANCGTNGATWSFTTMQDPNLIQLCDPFTTLSNWTIVGPLGMTNWTANNSANAGGTPPELMMSWSPSFVGMSLIRSTTIPLLNNWPTSFSFKFFLDYYGDPSGTITVSITYDGGATESILYQTVDPTGNIGPIVISGSFTTPATGSNNAQIQIWYNGDSFNVDYIYWDDMCVGQVVPVELTSFNAIADYGVVELSWITATETNNQGFEVQRSNGGEFETIAFVEGHGTTTETQAYSYSDKNVNVGLYNYRLKQIDFDGTFTYSNVVAVDVPILQEFALDQNYPNPFNPSTKIAFSLAVDSKVSLKVFDVLGQEVANLVNTNLVAGAHNVDFNASSLNSGVYLYRLEATGIDGTNFVSVKKMILTK